MGPLGSIGGVWRRCARMGVGLVSESRCVFGNLMTLPVDPVPLRSSSAIDLTVAEITNFAVAY